PSASTSSSRTAAARTPSPLSAWSSAPASFTPSKPSEASSISFPTAAAARCRLTISRRSPDQASPRATRQVHSQVPAKQGEEITLNEAAPLIDVEQITLRRVACGQSASGPAEGLNLLDVTTFLLPGQRGEMYKFGSLIVREN